MRESLQHEKVALMAYCDLLKNGKDSNRQEPVIQAVSLEEYARKKIIQEEMCALRPKEPLVIIQKSRS